MLRFIHIPKTGGTSVVDFCHRNHIPILYGVPTANGTAYKKKHSTYQDWRKENSDKFAVIRDPRTRLVSWFRYLSQLRAYSCSFQSFVLEKLEPVAVGFKTPSPWTPQTHWISYNGSIGKVKLLKFETLQNDLPKFLNCNDILRQKNVSNHTNYNLHNWYNSKTRKVVFEHFKEDMILWQMIRSDEC